VPLLERTDLRLFTPIPVDQSLALLCDACTRNVSADLHVERTQGECIIAKARLLGYENDRLFVDAPGDSESGEAFAAEQKVTVYFQVGGTRYSFQTEVIQPSFRLSLNERVTVPVLILRVPLEIQKNQRRRNVRVSLAAKYDVTVKLHEGGYSSSREIPIDAEQFQGRLIDLSMSGMRLIVDVAQHGRFRLGERYYATLQLPNDPQPFSLWIEVRYVRAVRGGEALQIGFLFLDWEGIDATDDAIRLNRFIQEAHRSNRATPTALEKDDDPKAETILERRSQAT